MLIPFLRERSATILLLLRDQNKEWIISSLSKHVDLTYLHTLNIINQYYNLGLIEFTRQGRRKIIKLTSKGVKIANLLSETIEVLKSSE